MKISTIKRLRRIVFIGALICSVLCIIILPTSKALAKVIDTDPVTEQRWIISEMYLGGQDYTGAYLELYNNDDNAALGWKDFIVNLPFNLDLPPIFDLHTYKSHAYKKFPIDEGWAAWIAKKYLQIMYGDEVFYEIQDALDEEDGYSYQRCQYSLPNGQRVLSNKFYYGKKTPGKAIECSDSSVTDSSPASLPKPGACIKLKLNEIASNFKEEKQFIEVINSGTESIDLSKCYVSTKLPDQDKLLTLGDKFLPPGELYHVYLEGTKIAPINKKSGILYLVDSDRQTILNYKRYSDVPTNAGVAVDSSGGWQITYKLTPGTDNIIDGLAPCPSGKLRDKATNTCKVEKNETEKNTSKTTKDNTRPSNTKNNLKPCRSGYERNPETNRCRKIKSSSTKDNTSNNELKPCRDGYERNPETNRCRKISSDNESLSILAPCREGYMRNPETNRCIKISNYYAEKSSSLTPCRDGYERNPETNRCVKKKSSTESTLTPCRDGYERNPETNRCIKKKIAALNTDDTPKFPVTNTTTDDSNNIDNTTPLIIIASIIAAVSAIILMWQYRTDVANWLIGKKALATPKAKDNILNDDSAKTNTSEWIDKLTKKDD